MSVDNTDLLSMSQNMVDSYLPLQQIESLILLSVFKEYQLQDNFDIDVEFSKLDFVFDDKNRPIMKRKTLVKFFEKHILFPIFINDINDRKIEYFVKESTVFNDFARVSFDSIVDDYFKSINEPYLLDIRRLSALRTSRNRRIADIKFYMMISKDYSLLSTDDDGYLAYTLDSLYFILSVFDWNNDDSKNLYLADASISEMISVSTKDKYNSTASVWTNVRYFVKEAIKNINRNTDIYIDEEMVTLNAPGNGNKIEVVIFKVSHNLNNTKNIGSVQKGLKDDNLIKQQDKLRFLYNKLKK